MPDTGIEPASTGTYRKDEESNTVQQAQANNLNIDLEHKRYRHMSEEYLKEMNPSLRKQKLSILLKCQECKRAN